jgi:integrase
MRPSLTDIALFDLWMHENGNLAESTMHLYFHCTKRFLAGNPDLENLEDYNNFLIEHTVKKRTMCYYAAIKLFVDYKITKKEVRERILDGLLRPPIRYDIKKERKYLPEEKIIEVLNFLQEDRHRIIALIQTLTGVRASDVLRLKTDGVALDVYNKKSTLRLSILGKGKKRHVVYIHDIIAQEIITKYVKERAVFYKDYIFLKESTVNRRRSREVSDTDIISTNYNQYLLDLKSALMCAGVDINVFATHDFRRCFARRCWEKWRDVSILQSVLNHADPKTTLRYLTQSGLKNIDYYYAMQMGDEKHEEEIKNK